MAYSFEQTRAGYLAMWMRAKLLPDLHDKALAVARTIADGAHKPRFQAVEVLTGVPWFMVGCLLYRESDLDLSSYLGNGQPLNKVTTIVPKGRGPWGTFEAGAADALTSEGMAGISDWSIERILYWCERFNGQGYFNKGNSPYIWSWTDQYQGGLFVSDGTYSASTVDPRPGVAALLKALAELYPDIAQAIAPPTAQPVPALAPITTPETTPMATTTPTAVATISDPIPNIITMLNTAQGVLSKLATFIPAPYGTIAQDAIPIIEEALQLVEDFKTKSGTDLFQAIGARVEAIGQHFQTVGQGVQTAASPTPTATSTSGMPNS